MLPIREPVEVMCHGDFGPYNRVFKDYKVSSIIDFDTVHPGPRIWDISYTVYRWIPLMVSGHEEGTLSDSEKLRRLKLFLETYGFNYKVKDVLREVVLKIEVLVK